jgi:hypothetical protein
MAALTTAVHSLLPSVSVVVAKGGITSAEVAHSGIGATKAVGRPRMVLLPDT